jgi:hypothetical protein
MEFREDRMMAMRLEPMQDRGAWVIAKDAYWLPDQSVRGTHSRRPAVRTSREFWTGEKWAMTTSFAQHFDSPADAVAYIAENRATMEMVPSRFSS